MSDKEVIEPEIVKEKESKKNFDSFDDLSNFAKEFAEDELRGVKNKIILQGVIYIFAFLVILFLVIWLIAEVLSFILPPVLVIAFVCFIIFILGYPIYWFINKIKK